MDEHEDPYHPFIAALPWEQGGAEEDLKAIDRLSTTCYSKNDMGTLVSMQKKIQPLLQTNDVAFAGVFGSFVHGNMRRGSDIDILVRFRQTKSLFQIVDLEARLTRALRRKVDLVTEQALCSHIKKDILSDVQPLYGQR